METTYTWGVVGDGHTHMTLRNRGEPSGFAQRGCPGHGEGHEPGQRQGPRQAEAATRVPVTQLLVNYGRTGGDGILAIH